jgi:hypothetical protein
MNFPAAAIDQGNPSNWTSITHPYPFGHNDSHMANWVETHWNPLVKSKIAGIYMIYWYLWMFIPLNLQKFIGVEWYPSPSHVGSKRTVNGPEKRALRKPIRKTCCAIGYLRCLYIHFLEKAKHKWICDDMGEYTSVHPKNSWDLWMLIGFEKNYQGLSHNYPKIPYSWSSFQHVPNSSQTWTSWWFQPVSCSLLTWTFLWV